MKNNQKKQPHLTTHMVDENDPRLVINAILGIQAFEMDLPDTAVRVPENELVVENGEAW